MKYIEVTVMTTSAAQELVADCFFELNLEGVSIIDKNDLINLNKKCHKWDYIDDDIMATYKDGTLVKGFVEKGEYKEISKRLIEEFDNLKKNSEGYIAVGSLEMTTREIEGDDWVNTWKEHFKPIEIKNVVICPKWIDYPKKDNQTVVLLNVGMAFGTGEHETTSMCVELLQDFNLNGLNVYDIGCGSGILGITAVKLGAKVAIMSDIDEIAVAASRDNAEINGVLDKCDISMRNLLDGATI
ncbi:MAG: 50S ribosomal protein L11 methyltransferase, partial [Clostridia bacterium]